MGDFLLGQFPRGQRRALAARAGFVAKNMKGPARGLGGVNRRGGGSDINEGQPTGVAVGENPGVATDQFGAVAPDGGAMFDVLVGEFLGGRQGQGLLFLHRLSGPHGAEDALHCIDRIDGRGTGGSELVKNGLDVAGEFFQVPAAKGKGALRETESGGRTNGPCSTDHHVTDRGGRGAEIGQRRHEKMMGQLPLIDEHHSIPLAIERDGAVMGGAPAEGDIHGSGSMGPGL